MQTCTALATLDEIGTPERIDDDWIRAQVLAGARSMGCGLAVCRAEEQRARMLREIPAGSVVT